MDTLSRNTTRREKAPKLALDDHERRAFRAAKLTARSIVGLSGQELHRRLHGGVAHARCDEIAALADFQQLQSIGLESARDFVALGFLRRSDLKGQDPRELYSRMCKLTNSRQDPCVEDAFRCAIAQAEDQNIPRHMRDWWYWTSVRGRPMHARP